LSYNAIGRGRYRALPARSTVATAAAQLHAHAARTMKPTDRPDAAHKPAVPNGGGTRAWPRERYQPSRSRWPGLVGVMAIAAALAAIVLWRHDHEAQTAAASTVALQPHADAAEHAAAADATAAAAVVAPVKQ
jgi:hypothetical protein